MTKVFRLKLILDSKITSVSSDFNTIYLQIRLKFTLVDGILSNEILFATSFSSLILNLAVPLSFLQQYLVAVVTLSSLIDSYCLIFFESAL